MTGYGRAMQRVVDGDCLMGMHGQRNVERRGRAVKGYGQAVKV